MKSERMDQQTEISFAGEVPLIPSVRPVVILSGTDYEMGYQYYQQVIQIFGPWILESIKRQLTGEELAILKAFQRNIRQYTPEFVDFFKGMADGAAAAGVPLTYQEVLAVFTAYKSKLISHIWRFLRPNRLDGSYANPPPGSEDEQLPPEGCSSWAAWGSATKDGKPVCCGAMESPMAFTTTIVAFPGEGNNFIHSPLVVPGADYYGWRQGFWGFPGMNNKGLVYVHHGATMFNPKEEFLYGVPGGMQVVHNLRFAKKASEALQNMLDTPGQLVPGPTLSGNPGASGFWVDISGDAFVVENWDDPLIIRRAGYAGEKDFLYATNNRICKESNNVSWCRGVTYDPHAGWLEEREKVLNKPEGVGRFPGEHAFSRNIGIWNLMHNYHGEIDLEFAKMTWRFLAQEPGSKELKYRICSKHCNNLGIALPDNGDGGLYYVSTGSPARIGTPIHPDAHAFRIAPTYSFYQLKLAASPENVMDAALLQANHDLHYAEQELRKLTYHDPAYAPLDEIYNKAATEWFKGGYYQSLAQKTTGNEHIYNLSKALRAFTRCQAFARQVYNALVPPATQPEDLGLRTWFGDWGDWAK